MPILSEQAYAYAKACGIVRNSFIGRKIATLDNINRFDELDKLVFAKSSQELPEKEFLVDFEGRIKKRSIDSIAAVVKSFKTAPEFISLLIRAWEYDDLKNMLIGHGNNEPTKPLFTDLGSFSTINFSAWPDISAMLQGTEFEYLLGMMDKGSAFLHTELDRHYYSSLWKALTKLKREDRQVAAKILTEEISLRNVAWALRLRTYYHMEEEQVRSHLIDIKAALDTRHYYLADDAFSSLGLPLDNRYPWLKWKRVAFLNPQTGGEWRADPRYFQNAAAQYLYRIARRAFHFTPSSLDAIYCFIKIKQFEEDILISTAEGLGMGMSSHDVFALVGIES